MFVLYRKLTICILLLVLILLMANCGRNEANQAEAAQPAELVWVSLDVSSQVEETLAESYQQDHPHITFDRQPLNFSQDYFSASPAPDLVIAFVDRAYFQAGSTNQLADLSEVWNEAGLNEQLFANVQNLVKDRESGKPHMMPIAFTWAAIYYNKELFAQYNLQPPQTWDEFMQICAILQANGETPLAMAGMESNAYTLWFDYLNLRLNGAQFHRDLLEGKERFDDPSVVSVLEIWRNLFDQGYVVAHPEFMNASAAINSLIRSDNGLLSGDEAAMVLIDTITVSGTPIDFRDEFDFFRFPIIDPNIPIAESIDVIGYVVPTNAANGAEAQYFLTYVGSPAAQELIAREAAVINAVYAPVRADLDDSVLTDDMNKAISMLQETAETVPFSYQTMHPALWEEFNRAFRKLLTNKQDIQSFVDAMEMARQSIIE